MSEQYLVANRWKTPDGTILWSKHRHDYVEHTDAITGEYLCVDGGNEYSKLTGKFEQLVDLCIYNTDKHELVREFFLWGSYGYHRDKELHFILLKDLTNDHIDAILQTQTKLPSWKKHLFEQELNYRSN